MTQKKAIEAIVKIEKNIPVDKIECRGIKIWPLIRGFIWPQLLGGQSLNRMVKKDSLPPPPPRRSIRQGFDDELSRIVQNYLAGVFRLFSNCRLYINNKRFKPTEVVFLSRSVERKEKVDQKYFNPFANSLQDLLNKMGLTSVILEFPPDPDKKPIYGEAIFIDQEMKLAELRGYLQSLWLKRVLLKKKKSEVPYWQELISYLNKHYPKVRLKKPMFIEMAEHLLMYQKMFEKLFKRLKPKACFVVGYYYLQSMACLRACRKFGVKSVDIQHGKQGKYQAMYTRWTKVPPGGYDLLPYYFWSWGKASAARINQWSQVVHPIHKAIIGGNLWLAKWLHGELGRDSFPSPLEKIAPVGKINVLVALPPIAKPINQVLMETIKNASEDINWLIPLHYVMKKRKREIKNQLAKTKNRNIKIEPSIGPHSVLPLYSLLRRVDFILTFWSSLAMEALAFQVHPIIIHPEGKEIFSRYIKEGLFDYARSAKEVLAIIKKDRSQFKFTEKEKYIETDEKIAELALKEICREGYES